MSLAEALAIAPRKYRPPFTLLEARRRIMGELAHIPESKRARALQRRLTPFDRSLSEEQAAALDRLARGHLAVLAQLGAAPIREAVNSSRGHSLPFGESDRDLIGAYRYVLGIFKRQSATPALPAALALFLRSVEPDAVLPEQEPQWAELMRAAATWAAQLFRTWEFRS